MSLNCNEFDELLAERAEFRGDADESLRAHAQTCSRCDGVWLDKQIVEAAVEEWNAAVPESNLVGRVVARWAADSVAVAAGTARPLRAPGHRLLLGVVASALLVGVVSLLFTGASTQPPVGTGGFADVTGDGAPQPGGAASTQPNSGGPLKLVVDGARRQYANVTDSVTRKMSVLTIPKLDDVKSFGPFNRGIGAAARGTTKQRGWGTGLQPVGRDVQKAFGFLRDAVPVLSDSST